MKRITILLLSLAPLSAFAQTRIQVGPAPTLTPTFYGLGAGLAAPTLGLMGPGLSAVAAPSLSLPLPSVLPTVAAPAAVAQAALPAPVAAVKAVPAQQTQTAVLPGLEALNQELSRRPAASAVALNQVFDQSRPSKETVQNTPLPPAESRLKGPGRVTTLQEFRKVSEAQFKPFESFSPSSIKGGLRRGFVLEGLLNKTFSLTIRITPGKVEVRKKHFAKPAQKWRSASTEELQGLSAALKRHVDALPESAKERPLYLVVYGALLGRETAEKHSLAELRKAKDRLVGFLIHPQVPHQGFQVSGIGLSGGKVVVNVVSKDQIAAVRTLVENRFPEFKGLVKYKAVGRITMQGSARSAPEPRWILRYSGVSISEQDKARITGLKGIRLIDATDKMLLVEGDEALIAGLVAEMPGWKAFPERKVRLADS